MSDQLPASQNLSALKAIFSPPVLAALRNVLSAIGPLLGMLGLVTLSPQQIDKIIAVGQQMGVVIGAIIALLGLLTPLVMAAIAAGKSTVASNIARTQEIAADPSQVTSVAAAAAIVGAASQLAKTPALASEDAQKALVSATIALPSVQGIQADKHIADGVDSESVTAATPELAPADNEHAADAAAAARARPLSS